MSKITCPSCKGTGEVERTPPGHVAQALRRIIDRDPVAVEDFCAHAKAQREKVIGRWESYLMMATYAEVVPIPHTGQTLLPKHLRLGVSGE